MDFEVLRKHGFHYFDHAATTFMPDSVLDAWREYHENIGVYYGKGLNALNTAAYDEYVRAGGVIKRFFSLEDYRLVYGKNVTELINVLAYMIEPLVNPMDIIAVGPFEHHSNLLPWKYLAKRRNALFVELPIDVETGGVDFRYLDSIKERLRVLSVSSVSNAFGAVTNIASLERYIPEDALLLVDESQLAAHGEIYRSERIDVHFLPSHKMYGPKGIAAAAIRPGAFEHLQPLFLGGGMVKKIDITDVWQPDERRFEAGTQDIGAIKAWAAACEYLKEHARENQLITEKAFSEVHSAAEGNPRLRIVSDEFPSAHSIVSVVHESIHPHDFERIMCDNGIIIRSGHLCSQNSLRKIGLTAINRISFGLCCTDNGIEKLCEVLSTV